jgi:hypothetical protein
MCFSATASFTAAALTGSLGIAALYRCHQPRDRLIAAMPLFFAVQQAAEGLLWLALEHGDAGHDSSRLAVFFVFMAEAFWPVYAPIAVYRAETDEKRKRTIRVCMAAGLALGTYLLYGLISRPQDARIEAGHIVYQARFAYPQLLGLLYLAVTGLPMLMSSQRVIAIVGAIVTMGSAIAFVFYTDAYISVWCFFAATASAILVLHFERLHRRRLLPEMPIPSLGDRH